jgi:hypothetical protein
MKRPLLLAAVSIFVGDLAGAAPPNAPIACYRDATDRALSNTSAVSLCMGTSSQAPAACFADAVDNARISEGGAVRLCRGAASQAPATCVKRLVNATDLDERAIVSYCAAAEVLAPASMASDPKCLEAAAGRADLPPTDAPRVCRGSIGTSAVECFLSGKDQTDLSDGELMDLCAPLVPSY